LLHQCATGEVEIMAALLELNVGGFFENYFKHTKEREPEATWFSGFNYWLDNYYPPAVIESNIKAPLELLGLHFLPEHLRICFVEWVVEIKQNVDFELADHSATIKRFRRTLSWFEATFVTNAVTVVTITEDIS
jgi:hypothetical protein